MELPVITLPKVELPFDIPTILHPMIDHFMVVVPVIILLLELINIVVKKRSIAVISFFFLFVTVLIISTDHFIDVTYMKEGVALLGESGQAAFTQHQLLGAYLVITVAVVFVLKLLSILWHKALIKAFYLLLLIVFVVGVLQQSREGDRLIYEYGLNVSKIKSVKQEVIESQKALDQTEEELKKAKLEIHAMSIKLQAAQKELVAQKATIEALKTEKANSASPIVEVQSDTNTTLPQGS